MQASACVGWTATCGEIDLWPGEGGSGVFGLLVVNLCKILHLDFAEKPSLV
jgi:hypothetical protein